MVDEQHRQILGSNLYAITIYMECIESSLRFYGDDCNAEAISSIIQDILDLKQAVMGGTPFKRTFNRVSTHTKAELLKKACEESGEESEEESEEEINLVPLYNWVELKRCLYRAIERFKDIDKESSKDTE